MADKLEGTILIVDDMAENVTLLSRILANQGYTVQTADNGPQAIEIAQTSSPDLILLDINMPGMDGFETCVRLKQDERTRDIPVIFISALDAIDDKVKAFHAGVWARRAGAATARPRPRIRLESFMEIPLNVSRVALPWP